MITLSETNPNSHRPLLLDLTLALGIVLLILTGRLSIDVPRTMPVMALALLAGFLKLFVGRANCRECHAGSNFSNGSFHSNGVPPGGRPPTRGVTRASRASSRTTSPRAAGTAMPARSVRDAALDRVQEPTCRWTKRKARQLVGLGDDFLDELSVTLQQVENDPDRFPKLETAQSEQLRRCRLARFPYLIIFEILDAEIHLSSSLSLLCFHNSNAS